MENLETLKQRLKKESEEELNRLKRQKCEETKNRLQELESLEIQKTQHQEKVKQFEEKRQFVGLAEKLQQLQERHNQFHKDTEARIEELKDMIQQLESEITELNETLISGNEKFKSDCKCFEQEDADMTKLVEQSRGLDIQIQICRSRMEAIKVEELELQQIETEPNSLSNMRRRDRMPEHEYRTIQHNFPDLLKLIKNPDQLLGSLFRKGVFDDDDLLKVEKEKKNKGHREATIEILKRLLDSGHGTFDIFLQCLTSETLISQVHVPGLTPDRSTDCGHPTPRSVKLDNAIVEAKSILDATEKYVKTKAYHAGCEILERHLVLGIVGATGDGKSVVARMVVNSFLKKHPDFIPIVMKSPTDFDMVPFKDQQKYIIIADDIMGKIKLSKQRKQGWLKHFETIFLKKEKSNLAFVYILRDYIYHETRSLQSKYDILSDEFCILLFSPELKLNKTEKECMLKYHDKTLKKGTVDYIVSQTSQCFGFPHLARFLCRLANVKIQLRKGFYDFLHLEFDEFWQNDKTKYATFYFIFREMRLYKNKLQKGGYQIKTDLFPNIVTTSILSDCRNLSDSYTEAHDGHTDGTFYSLRSGVSESYMVHLFEYDSIFIIQHAPLNLLMDILQTKGDKYNTTLRVLVEVDLFPSLVERFQVELGHGHSSVLLHSAFIDVRFLESFVKIDKTVLSSLCHLYISLGDINNSQDDGNFIHRICLFGDAACLQVLIRHVSVKLLQSKTLQGFGIVDLAVLSDIDSTAKFDLLRDHKLLPPQSNILYLAAQSDNLEFVKSSWRLKSDGHEYVNDSKRSALHAACYSVYDNVGIIEFLIHKGLTVNFQDDDGCTPLHLAVRIGKHKTVECLIQHKSSVNLSNTQGQLPIHVSSSSNAGRLDIMTTDIVTKLVKAGSHVNKSDLDGRTPLLEAVANSDAGTTEYLLSVGAKLTDEVVSEAFKCLKKHPQVVEQILKGLDFPLHAAALYCDDISQFQTIVDRHITMINKLDYSQQTTLYKACLSVYSPIEKIKILINKGANATLPFINHICVNSKVSVLKYLIDHKLNIGNSQMFDLLRVCCQSDVDQVAKLHVLTDQLGVNDCDTDGRSILHYHCQYGSLESTQKLVKSGAKLDAKDNQGNNVFYYCCQSKIDQEKKVKLAIQSGLVSVNSVDIYDRTVLHWACWYGSLSTVQTLIEAGATVDAKDNKGNNVFYYCLLSKIDKEEKVEFVISLVKLI